MKETTNKNYWSSDAMSMKEILQEINNLTIDEIEEVENFCKELLE